LVVEVVGVPVATGGVPVPATVELDDFVAEPEFADWPLEDDFALFELLELPDSVVSEDDEELQPPSRMRSAPSEPARPTRLRVRASFIVV
jgi:hypothetical protein